MKDKILYSCLGIIAGLIVGYFALPHVPDIKTVVETKVLTKTVMVNKDRVVDRETIKYKDGTVKIVEHEVVKDKIVEKEVTKDKIVETIKYDKTAFLFLNVGFGVGVNPNFLAPSKDIIINYENVSVGIAVNLRPYIVSIDYQHVNNYPDIVGIKVSIPIF